MLKKWLNSYGHAQGIFWTICSCVFGNMGDVAAKLLSHDLPTMQVTFCRLFFGLLLLVPFFPVWGKQTFRIKSIPYHISRVIVGFGAIAFWLYGVGRTSLPSITTISFACPLFVLPLAYICLGEKSDWRRMLSVILGFIGVLIIAFYEKVENGGQEVLAIHWGVVALICGAILFALSDIFNKKMLATENFYAMLFYFYLGTALISFIPALLVWQPLGMRDMFYLLMLSGGGLGILYCILKAARATEISAIAPYKYTELIISIFVGYLVFGEVIKFSTLLGAGLIIPSAFYSAYYEIKKSRIEIRK